MATKIIAQTNFDHEVKLIDAVDRFIVKYGLQTRDCGGDFRSAWEEFEACSKHSAVCAGLTDADDYDGMYK